MTDWFTKLVGFKEEAADQVRAKLALEGTQLRSTVNNAKFECGRLETPTLATLRDRLAASGTAGGTLRVAEVVGDVQKLYADPENAGATFQVASQFNLLEMVSPDVKPEQGGGQYEHDLTQGPACAIACGAGTIYRSYFVELDRQLGQTADRQVDCLADLGKALGNTDGRLWEMRNGYALPTREGLEESEWEPFAQLVLNAAYEATFCAAALNAARTGNPKLYLTSLGGGAFGNNDDWILSAIRRSLDLFQAFELDVRIVSFRRSNPRVQLLESLPGGDRRRRIGPLKCLGGAFVNRSRGGNK